MCLSFYPEMSVFFNIITENFDTIFKTWHEFKNSVAIQVKFCY
jgi:hypothetical protein